MTILYSRSYITVAYGHDLGASADILSLAHKIMLRSSQPRLDMYQDIEPLQHAEVSWLISNIIGSDQEGAIYCMINGTLSETCRILIRKAIDEAFVMVNYSRLEPPMRRRMRELRLQGVATRLNYSSEDVDEEREMELPPGFQPRPSGMTEEPIMGNIPPLLAFHLRET
ncbi:hypothetical protein Tco_0782484 [Tanacetum coccineum]